MKERFLQFVLNKNLFKKEDKILVAVSGGIDSCALLYLFYSLDYKCVVAHCNFSLRNEESDKDEKFVKDLSSNYQFEFASKRFDTFKYAEENGISIQMAAREQRYRFFEETRQKHNCRVIATAHNADDNIETLFINLIRGTGLKGLSGIPVKLENIVRPLLYATRKEILAFAKSNKILWREDLSNQSFKYMRNKIRHYLLPLLEEIKPGCEKTILRNIEHFSETEVLLKKFMKEKISEIVIQKDNLIFIDIAKLLASGSAKTILYEIIAPYGFNPKQVITIWSSINAESGKVFYSKNFCINKDRNKIIISRLNIGNLQQKYYIDELQEWISEPIEMSVTRITWEKGQNISRNKNIAMLDADTIEFPLILRRWAYGDYFKPIGMQGYKKLSDFFIDEKISNIGKENVWIIESANRIVWLAGLKPDDRFKITEKTKSVIKMEIY